MGKRWQIEKKKEHYYRSAKKENYRSRASYKLQQINNKYKIIKAGDVVLDLGAAPGGWTQVALQQVGKEGKVIAVDLKRIKPFKESNFYFIQGDFTQKEIQDTIIQKIDGKVEVIICDASPSLYGIKDIDQQRTMNLGENVLKIANYLLKDKGNLLMKSFQGSGYEDLLKKIKKRFKVVKTTKPPSSRKSSSEMYLIALGFKANS